MFVHDAPRPRGPTRPHTPLVPADPRVLVRAYAIPVRIPAPRRALPAESVARRRAHDRTARRSSLGMRDQHEMRWSRTATGQNKARVSQRASASAFRAHSLSIDAPPHAHLSPDRTEPRRTVRSGRPVRGRTACTRRRGRTKTARKRTVGRSHGNTGISPTRTKRCALELSHHTSWWCVSRRRAGPLNCADCLRREELQMPVHAVACARGGRVGARRRERW